MRARLRQTACAPPWLLPWLPNNPVIGLQVGFGDHVRVVGSHAQLGAWNTQKGKELGWTDGNVWTATVELPAGEEVQYKFVHVTRDNRCNPILCGPNSATSQRSCRACSAQQQTLL